MDTPYLIKTRGNTFKFATLPKVPTKYVKALPAFQEYTARTVRKTHPDGKFDKGGRFYPSDREYQPCCQRIRSPSRAYPYSYMTHCRSANHIAHLYEIEPRLLRGLIAWVRYYIRDVKDVPDLCDVCGASWQCEHSPYKEPEGLHYIDPVSETLGQRLPRWRERAVVLLGGIP